MGPISGTNPIPPPSGSGGNQNIQEEQADYCNYLIMALYKFRNDFVQPQAINWIDQLYNIKENVPFPGSVTKLNQIISEINSNEMPWMSKISPFSANDVETNAKGAFSLFEFYVNGLINNYPENINEKLEAAIMNLQYNTNLTPQQNINYLNNLSSSLSNSTQLTFPQFEATYQ